MEKLTLVWLKKDLRTLDHAPLQDALKSPHKVLIIYCFEPFISYESDFNLQQWQFALGSLEDLISKNIPVHLFHDSITNVLTHLRAQFELMQIYAHQETGTLATYRRDIEVRDYCKKNGILFKEYSHHGIWRGLKTSENWKTIWSKYWHHYVTQMPLLMDIDHSKFKQLSPNLINELNLLTPADIKTRFSFEDRAPTTFKPGETAAQEKLKNYISDENNFKKKKVSGNGKYSTLEISPYIAFGNISIRQVYHVLSEAIAKASLPDKIYIEEIQNRLKWHCLTSQEFEMNGAIEFESIKNSNLSNQSNREYLKAIKKGQTGYPFVDAILRALLTTGHISFRQRSLLMSFACHRLKLPWQEMARFLAKHFIDYNPGVHYVQCQMQAGTLPGTTLRIYDPIKQSKDKDPQGEFIKRWVPELQSLPKEFIHEPWKYEAISTQITFKLGKNYPKPIDNQNKPLRVYLKYHK
jgi:deoxyribodipyrimidine photo-lyase